MSSLHRTLCTLGLVAAAFAGGAVTAEVSHATPGSQSPYAPLDQMARALVHVENFYVDPVAREKLLAGAIHGMVAELDPHSAYMDPKEFEEFNEETQGRFAGIGIEVDYRDETVTVIAPIPGSPAARAGVRSGDRIVAVDGKPLRGLSVDKIISLMRGPVGSRVRVSVQRAGAAALLSFELVRENVQVPSIESKRLSDDIGYVRLEQFQTGTHDELLGAVAALRRASEAPLRGIVLDLRNNPGGLVDEAEAVADELLADGVIYTTRHRGRVLDDVRAHRGGALASVPVVVLVNEYSASAAELVAGALQDNGRATVMGARTFGKGSVQTIFELPGGAGMRLTTMRYYTPKGRAIQAAGILPDVAIEYDPDPSNPFDTLREETLDNHLEAERHGPERSAEVLPGGKRPELKPLTEMPTDPRQSDDAALRFAHARLLAGAGRTER